MIMNIQNEKIMKMSQNSINRAVFIEKSHGIGQKSQTVYFIAMLKGKKTIILFVHGYLLL
jgi:hypothetical protein